MVNTMDDSSTLLVSVLTGFVIVSNSLPIAWGRRIGSPSSTSEAAEHLRYRSGAAWGFLFANILLIFVMVFYQCHKCRVENAKKDQDTEQVELQRVNEKAYVTSSPKSTNYRVWMMMDDDYD